MSWVFSSGTEAFREEERAWRNGRTTQTRYTLQPDGPIRPDCNCYGAECAAAPFDPVSQAPYKECVYCGAEPCEVLASNECSAADVYGCLWTALARAERALPGSSTGETPGGGLAENTSPREEGQT